MLRQLNGVVAGSLEMPWRRFLMFNALGGAAWVLCWTLIGYHVGQHGTGIAALLHKIGYAGMVVVLAAVIGMVVYLHRRRTP